jgi:hypothetical protein
MNHWRLSQSGLVWVPQGYPLVAVVWFLWTPVPNGTEDVTELGEEEIAYWLSRGYVN